MLYTKTGRSWNGDEFQQHGPAVGKKVLVTPMDGRPAHFKPTVFRVENGGNPGCPKALVTEDPGFKEFWGRLKTEGKGWMYINVGGFFSHYFLIEELITTRKVGRFVSE